MSDWAYVGKGPRDVGELWVKDVAGGRLYLVIWPTGSVTITFAPTDVI